MKSSGSLEKHLQPLLSDAWIVCKAAMILFLFTNYKYHIQPHILQHCHRRSAVTTGDVIRPLLVPQAGRLRCRITSV